MHLSIYSWALFAPACSFTFEERFSEGDVQRICKRKLCRVWWVCVHVKIFLAATNGLQWVLFSLVIMDFSPCRKQWQYCLRPEYLNCNFSVIKAIKVARVKFWYECQQWDLFLGAQIFSNATADLRTPVILGHSVRFFRWKDNSLGDAQWPNYHSFHNPNEKYSPAMCWGCCGLDLRIIHWGCCRSWGTH